ncbi:MAG: PAS domain S-box protein, partial [Methanotrichaceae archaeon]
EEILKKSEERYRTIFEKATEGIFQTSIQGRLLQANPALAKMFGFASPEEMIESITDLGTQLYVHSEDRERLRKLIAEHDLVENFEAEGRTKDGQSIWVSINIHAVRDPNGAILYLDGTNIDITARKQMEHELRQSKDELEAKNVLLTEEIAERKRTEEALVAANRKFTEVINKLDALVYVADMERYEVLFINQHGRKLFGDIEGQLCWRTIQKGQSGPCEFCTNDKLIGPDGNPSDGVVWEFQNTVNERWYQCRDRAILWSDSRIVRMEIATDITANKRAEKALLESEARYRRIVETANEGIMMMDNQFRYAFVNQKLADMLGYTPQEMLGRSVTSFIFEEDLPDHLAKMEKRRSGVGAQYERRHRRKDGSTCWTVVSATALKDEAGHFAGSFAMLTDITERKLIEEELRSSQRILADIINFLPDATMVIDRQGRVIAWNQVIETMTGVNAKDIMGKGNYEYAIPFYGIRRPILIDLVLLPQEDFEKSYAQFERRDGILFGEAYMPNMKRGETYLSASAAILYDHDGNVYGAIESIRDITDRKKTEEQKRIAEEELKKAHDELELRVKERTAELEARNAEMERFVYTVSHELRTPLISVSGFLGFVKQDSERGDLDRMQADLRIANEAVTKMDQLLLETLELSRIGRIVNPPENVPFREIVEDALRQTSEKIKSKGCKVSVAQNLPVVHVDRMRITEVLTNLIENSLKYGGLQTDPEIEIGQRIDGQNRIFFVRDNGIGIDPSQYDKVFELFYKVNKQSEGTGAGLAIVKRIIEVHGGRIWIESELGKGCMICFTLPLADYQ